LQLNDYDKLYNCPVQGICAGALFFLPPLIQLMV